MENERIHKIISLIKQKRIDRQKKATQKDNAKKIATILNNFKQCLEKLDL